MVKYDYDKILPALVSLYDSLNNQIEKAEQELIEIHRSVFYPDPSDKQALEEFKYNCKRIRERTDKLLRMRDSVESKIDFNTS